MTGRAYPRPYSFYRCPRCDLISPAPLPSEAELLAYYTGYRHYAKPEHFDRVVAGKRVQAARLVKKLRRLLGARFHGARLLEVGCAAGALLYHLAKEPALWVRGLDIDAENTAVARERLGLDVVTGALPCAALAPGSFDAVFAEQVLEHVLDPGAFLVACRDLLAPGGVLIVGTPNFSGLSARLLGLGWKEYVPYEHVRMFTRRALGYHLERAGFVRVHVGTQGLSLIRRYDQRDFMPLARAGLAGRALNLCVRIARLGDNLMATAFSGRRDERSP